MTCTTLNGCDGCPTAKIILVPSEADPEVLVPVIRLCNVAKGTCTVDLDISSVITAAALQAAAG